MKRKDKWDLIEEQLLLIIRLTHMDIPSAMEELDVPLALFVGWQRDPFFRSLVKEMQGFVKQIVTHRALLEANRMLEDLSALSEHYSIRERMRTLKEISSQPADQQQKQKDPKPAVRRGWGLMMYTNAFAPSKQPDT